MQIVNISDAKILLVQRQYECRKEKFIMENNIFERIEKNLHVYYDNLINQFKQKKIQIGAGNANAASQLTNSLASAQQARIQQIHQIQAHLAAQKAQTQASTQAQLSKKAQVNNQAAVKVEATIPDTINNTPNIQPKSLTETIKTEAKNLKASSSEVFTNEENDKTTTSSSTKKRNNRKTNTTSSSSVSSINNLSSKKSESSSTESGSKKLANSSKDQVKLEKDDSFLGKINRNINIFALESKNYKTHIKSNSKTRNIIQNSFKYIIDPNHPAYGINSCAEEISSLCFQSNNIERKTKPLKLENINDSSNDHISLFEDIINRKSHIITSENDNDNKKPQTNKMIADDNERNKVGTKRKFDEMTNTDSIIVNNSIKKATVKDKYSSIIDEINFLKDKYKINVNIVDTSNISLLLKEKENKSGEIPWNDFINMINIIKKEEYQDTTENHTLMNINYNDTSIKQKNAQQKINNERVMLVISLNLSNYIDTTEVENEYNIPGDNQNNIVIYARIPKSTQRYSLQGIFDWSLLYTKKKSIFQNSEEDNKLKEKKIYDFISHKLHDQDETSAKEKINMDIENKHPITISNRVIKVYNIVEWIVEGIKS
ncbi:hypothetical protein BCR36DRAFT_395198 [Piromyces finnis]|uniref:Uncharacterized protein n=1 Tax=Piromyces finnis TaxID=1754191 RepID=A0A1Y1VJK6_9FUNG|nr:hypothetical protein BCR36DRAFT_395198 [Piromyces finnis]|eukprot:ORX57891.1 hypothetical protein BCR36DRAFT_395198 [Piromyces finnis]